VTNDFDAFQDAAAEHDVVTVPEHMLPASVFGLCGEAGEVAEKVKKVYRDRGGRFTEWDRMVTAEELGDVLWYVANTARLLGYKLSTVAQMNTEKTRDRARRGVLGGSGDHR